MSSVKLVQRTILLLSTRNSAGPRDVAFVGRPAGVQQTVAANRHRIRIGKNGKGVTRFVAKIARYFGRVDTDSDRNDSRRLEFRQPLFNAS
jgi:hypothetical protein